MRTCAWCVLLLISQAACTLAAAEEKPRENGVLGGDFHWQTAAPVVGPQSTGGEDWIAIKDPSVVRYEGRWHLFCTVRGTKRSHAIVYSSFADWDEAQDAKQTVLSFHDGHFCAPQVFYFTPHKKWYLICQASDESWTPKYQAAYATSENIADPEAWSKLQPLEARPADGKTGLDFWIICDDAKAHLFFTTLDGRMWREETTLADFPVGWSTPQLAIRGDIFEAGHVYRLQGAERYLTLVEAQHGHGWRYYKAYTAETLDGRWLPLAAEKDNACASMRNVVHTTKRWTDVVSHVEALRVGYDEKLAVDPLHLRLIYQGVLETQRRGKKYGEIPWRLGLLELVEATDN